MRHTRGIVQLSLLLLMASLTVSARQLASVVIRLGNVQTTCYPACDHSTEWLQQVYADVYDSSGALIADVSAFQFEWAADFCLGGTPTFGYVAGAGLNHLAVDGNLIKSSTGCCDDCPFQTYRLAVRVRSGEELVTSEFVRVPNIPIPTSFALKSNFPNPFNGGTRIRFDLPKRARVELAVYDLRGRRVALLIDRTIDAGEHAVDWQPRGQASGTYLCRLLIHYGTNGRFTSTVRMVLEK